MQEPVFQTFGTQNGLGAPGAPGGVENNPKCLLNQFLMRYTGKPVSKGDIVYETVSTGNGFACICKLPTIQAKEEAVDCSVPEFFGEDCETEKLAEQSAAQKALDNYADWIKANPPQSKPKKLPPLKRDASEMGGPVGFPAGPLGAGPLGGPVGVPREPEKKMRLEDYNLKFVDAPQGQEEAARRKDLNNKPAWMTKGLGVNKEMFGESKGNLVKPGMYEDDLAKIEAKKGNPLGDGPDPFGDVFAERKTGDDVFKFTPTPASDPLGEVFAERGAAPANPWRSKGPLAPQESLMGGGPPPQFMSGGMMGGFMGGMGGGFM